MYFLTDKLPEDEIFRLPNVARNNIPSLSQHTTRLSHAQVYKPNKLLYTQNTVGSKSILSCIKTYNTRYHNKRIKCFGDGVTAQPRYGQLEMVNMLRKSEAWNELSRGSPFVKTKCTNLTDYFQVRLYATDSKGKNGGMRKESEITNETEIKQIVENRDQFDSEARRSYYDNYMRIFAGNSGFTGHHSLSSTSPDVEQVEPPDNKEPDHSRSVLSHTDRSGRVKMVDVGNKSDTRRHAVAACVICLGSKAFRLVAENRSKKGDVLSIAQVAGIMAAKNTSSLIPLCHNLILNKVDCDLSLNAADNSVLISCEVHTTGKTGVEMEALVGVSIAALTVYDMCKAVTHDIVISDIKLLEKEGGQSGHYKRN